MTAQPPNWFIDGEEVDWIHSQGTFVKFRSKSHADYGIITVPSSLVNHIKKGDRLAIADRLEEERIAFVKSLPVGEINAFDVILACKKHVIKMDELIAELRGKK